MNFRILTIAIALALIASPAQAKRHHHQHHSVPYRTIDRMPVVVDVGAIPAYGEAVGTSPMRSMRSGRARVAGGDAILLPHPAGCPRTAFCACGASVEVFGHSVRDLWPASAWYKFPRTSPAPGMVAVRSHHVFVLRSQVSGSVWIIADYNSGGHQSRLHERSIAGYAIVNPHGSRMASK